MAICIDSVSGTCNFVLEGSVSFPLVCSTLGFCGRDIHSCTPCPEAGHSNGMLPISQYVLDILCVCMTCRLYCMVRVYACG